MAGWKYGSVAALLVATACQGRIADPALLPGTNGPAGTPKPGDPNPTPNPTPNPAPDPCATRSLPVQPLRRLSAVQYRHVLEDLFGSQAGPVLVGSLFPPTVITRGFSDDAEANTVNTAQSNAIEDEAERIAALILAGPEPYLRALLPCTLPSPFGDGEVDACIDGFIQSFGAQAYRRPLTPTEVQLARGLYDTVRNDQTAVESWAALVQFFVQAPGLLYRVERGTSPVPGAAGLVRLSPEELAGRLSFLFLGAGPDPELLAAVAAGTLETPEQVADQAQRLMASPRFLEALSSFHRDWLHVYEADRGKDPTIFPSYTSAVQASLQDELTAFLRSVFVEGDGSLSTLLSSTEMPVDATLAAYYGVPAPTVAWTPVTLPHRQGLLTLASVQAALGKPTQSSPIHRGNFLRSSILCAPQLVLPANVDTSTPLAGTSGAPTARERLAPLLVNQDCAGCHTQINPMGFAFENYDGAGQWRDTENGAPIDASGMLDVGAGPVAFAGPTELAGLLADSPVVERCYALQWFRASLGRSETPEDACSLATLQTQVAQSGGDLRAVLVAITQTDAFLYRRPVEAP